MANKYFYTRQGDQEDVLHVGETGTLVGFTSDIGIAAVLAEMRRRSGQAAVSKELSISDFKRATELATQEKREFESACANVFFEP